MSKGKIRANVCSAYGITFDSESEARRYMELRELEERGEIQNLQVHPVFVIQPGVMIKRGSRRRKLSDIKFTPDFSYEVSGRRVIEDVKPHKNSKTTGKRIPFLTTAFRLRWNILQRQHPDWVFRIVEA